MSRRQVTAWVAGLALAVVLSTGSPMGMAGPVMAQDGCVEPSASPAPGPSAPLVMPEEYRIALFGAVWSTVDRLFLDAAFNGVDWQSVGDDYGRWILQTENAWEVYSILEGMVALLDDPYTLFMSPTFIESRSSEGQAFGGIGAVLDRRADESQGQGLRIQYVFPGSPAEKAGLRARDRIVAVNGDACVRIGDIRGPVGTPVRLTVISPGEEPRDIAIERGTVEPRIQPEARRLSWAPGVGYVRLLSLTGQETIDAATQGLLDLVTGGAPDSLLLDLRGTSSGAPGVAIALAGHFVSGEVGTLYAREGTSPYVVPAGSLLDDLESLPVVVLVDTLTEGPSEQLAAILQDQGRALVVGERTTGRTQGVERVDFPDGSAVQVVAYGLELSGGRRLEDTGVVPDVEITGDWLAFPESADPFLLAAIEAAEAPPAPSPAPSASIAPSPSPSIAPAPSVAPSPSIAPSPSG